jgi:hypothetical protein
MRTVRFYATVSIVLSAFCLFAAPSQAQTPFKVHVVAGDTDGPGTTVASSLMRRINAGDRFVNEPSSHWDIEIGLSCLTPKEMDVDRTGFVCSAVFIYAPDRWLGMEQLLDSAVVAGGDAEGAANQAYTYFSAAATPEKVKALDDRMTKIAAGVIQDYQKYQATHPEKKDSAPAPKAKPVDPGRDAA